MLRLFISASLLAIASTSTAQQWEFIEDLTPAGGEIEDYGLGQGMTDELAFVGWPHLFGEPTPDAQCGEVEVLRKDGSGRYMPETTLQAPNCAPLDGFGVGLYDFSEGLLAVPAMTGLDFNGAGNPANSRIVLFEQDASFAGSGGFNEGWRPIADVVGSRVGGNQGMGGKVLIDGDRLLVQATAYESVFGFNFARSNGIYVFERSGNSWNEVQFLSESTDFYGLDFELAGDQLLVGAPEAQTFGGPGKVYVYQRSGNQYSKVQELTVNTSNFGYHVEVQGDRASIGAVNLALDGSVFIFDRDSSGRWTQGQRLQNPTPADNDIYGIWSQLRGDELYVGAENGLDQTVGEGAVLVYELQGDQYQLKQTIVPPVRRDVSNPFGSFFTVTDTDLLIKAFGSAVGGETGFYHFQRDGGGNNGGGFQIDSGTSGLWYDPARNGEGFLIDVLDSGDVIVFWFTYDANGNQQWLIGQATPDGNRLVMEMPIVTSGARFGNQFDPDDVQRDDWGRLAFEFDDCSAGRVDYQHAGNLGSGSIELTRLSGIASIGCGGAGGGSGSDNGASGAYYDPARSGEGVQVQVVDGQSGPFPVVYWFTYDSAGNQVWFFGVGQFNGDQIVVNDTLQPMGPQFGADYDDADLVLTPWGSLSLDRVDCNTVTLNYSSMLAEFGSGQRSQQRLYQTAGTTCTD